MNTNNPLVSVIIPVYNGEQFLAEALESVIGQTYRPLDIIVVDDGSMDRSADIARGYENARYFFQTHQGLGAALNHGVRRATGMFFSFLDADDLWEKDKMTQQTISFDREPALDMVFGHIQQFFNNELETGDGMIRPPTASMPGYCKGAMLIRREAFYRVGLFDEQWQIGDFIDWYKRAQDAELKSLMLPDVVLWRRIHSDNMSTGDKEKQQDYVRILKAALDRRRTKISSSNREDKG